MPQKTLSNQNDRIMKISTKWLLAIGLMLCIDNVHAQQRFFCEVSGRGTELSFDFGTDKDQTFIESLKGFDFRDRMELVDANGKRIKFNNMVNAANYMASKGWNFQQAYSSMEDSISTTHWIFYKDAESLEKAKEGLTTRSDYKNNRRQGKGK